MFFSGRRAHDTHSEGPRRSLISALKLKFANHFDRHTPRDVPAPSVIALPASFLGSPPSRPEAIGRPRQLRRQRYHDEATFRGRSLVQHYSHPIHRLPVELLSHIFILGSQDSAYLPVTVSHVCQHWRRIALRTPALWRRITLSPKERMWKERIRRAKACSLDIQLLPSSSKIPRSLSRASRKFDKAVIELDPYSIQWHMHMVMPHIARWRSFEVAFPSYAPYLWKAALSRVCSHRGTQAPVLEDLRLTYRQNDDPEAFTLFSGIAPKLRSATLVGIRLKWLPSLFANLTTLDYTHHGFTVGYQAIQDVVDMLSVSSALVDLHLAFPRKPSPCLAGRAQPVHARVLLACVQRLTFRVESPDIPYELAVLSTLLLTPSLKTLNLVDSTHSYSSFTSLKQFFYAYALPRSLERVSVEWGWYDARMIEPITQGCRYIREIVVKKRGAEQVMRFPQQQLRSRSRDTPPPPIFPVQTPFAQGAIPSAEYTGANPDIRRARRQRTMTLPREKNLVSAMTSPVHPIHQETTAAQPVSFLGSNDRHFQIQRLNARYWKSR